MKYRVELLQNDTYRVIEYQERDVDFYFSPVVFQGSLSDCEAYIRLKQNENVDFWL